MSTFKLSSASGLVALAAVLSDPRVVVFLAMVAGALVVLAVIRRKP